ncbi:MAG: hypothetical protein ACRCYC_00230 [Paraclostridium sp.]|uniref:hypothetical protein n=1 Tax=Paraclostridium sp. TaxID=2023273 RepID=UPI003F2A7471
MESKIVLDENGMYKFDFSNCEYVLEFHDLANKSKLNDVDFITELNNEVLFIEYKNSNIPNAVRPEAMLKKIIEKPEKFYASIAKKYYDSLLVLWSCRGNEKDKPISYIFLIEDKLIDEVMRKKLKAKIKNQLPFNLKGDQILREVISKFEVYNLKEWNREFPHIKITPVE